MLREGGLIALFWNREQSHRTPLRRRLLTSTVAMA